MPTCRKCNKVLKWKQPYVKGKPFYENTTELSGKPHVCPKDKNDRITKYQLEHCELCPGDHSWFEKNTGKLEEHVRIMHPDGKKLVAIDFKLLSTEQRQKYIDDWGWEKPEE